MGKWWWVGMVVVMVDGPYSDLAINILAVL